jgi:hypothetical protein
MIKKTHLLLLTLFWLGLNEGVFAQGGWNIQYMSLKKIDSLMIGKEVRFDFKQNQMDTLTTLRVSKMDVRKLLHTEDTVKIMVLNEKVVFTERWKLYTDQGFIEDQYLVSIEPSNIRIEKMTLKRISSDSIYVNAELLINGISTKIELVISKEIIKGVLLKD